MGAYLSSPNREKESQDEDNCRLKCGVSSMQGWRVTQEDAHNCCLDFDQETNTSLFAVYDGHGGSEVAQYVSKHFPEFIRKHKSYTGGNLEACLEQVFLDFDSELIKEEAVKELRDLAGVEVEEEEEGEGEKKKEEELNGLLEEGTMPLENLLKRYGVGGGRKRGKDLNSPRLSAKKFTDTVENGHDEVKEDLREKLANGDISEGQNENVAPSCEKLEKGQGDNAGKKTEATDGTVHSNGAGAGTTAGQCESTTQEQEVPVKTAESTQCEAESVDSSKRDSRSRVAEVASVDSSSRVEESTAGPSSSKEASAGPSSSQAGSSAGPSSSQAGSSAGPSKSKKPTSEDENEQSSSEVTSTSSAGPSSTGAGSSSSGAGPSSSGAGPSSSGEAGPSSSRKDSSKNAIERARQAIQARQAAEGDGQEGEEDDSDEEDVQMVLEDDSEDDDIDDVNLQRAALLGQLVGLVQGADDDDEDDDEDDDDEDDDEEGDDEDDEGEGEGMGLLGPGMTTDEEPGVDSGCTAVVAVLRDRQLFVANAGDSRCVLCRAGKAVELSFDHKPEDDKEKERIENAGGQVTEDGRVNGGLNLSRALGDHAYKKNQELSLKDQMISSLPDIKTTTLQDDDEFMVLACDGIWNIMTSQEVITYVRDRLSSDVDKLSTICEEIFDVCLAPDTSGDGSGCDNMTCIIVKFQEEGEKKKDAGEGEEKKRKLEEEEAATGQSDPKRVKRDD